MTSDAIGAVLAGGAGSRMGRPKATVELGGRPLISYPLDSLAAAGLDRIVVAKDESELPDLDCPILREPGHPRHPVLGIVTALREAGGKAVVVVACDMPFVSAELLRHLRDHEEELAVCRDEDRLQPLLGRYEASLLPRLEQGVDRGEPAHRIVLDAGAVALGRSELSNFGDPERLLFNVNDAADLAAAESLVTG